MQRLTFLSRIQKKFDIHPICAILGARQVGKTTLAKMYIKEHFADNVRFFDLENPLDLSLLENPMMALSNIDSALIVIDEIQLRPDLFPILRVLADRTEVKQKFLILGSASRDLLRQSSETLAGRIGYIELPPFTIYEVEDSKKLWLRGGFPLSYLAKNEPQSMEWRQDYITTFLERDIPNLGFNVPPVQMRRFWLMLTYYHGQTFNSSEICRSLGISNHMVRKYLDILAGTFMIRILLPWLENIEKRQVKAPKIYFRDSGILYALLNITNQTELQMHPRLGSFWEGFALEEVINALQATQEECFFWATQAHAELDLFIFKGGKRLGFEFKYADAPKTTKSMHIAIEDLKLDHLAIIYPGNQIFPMDKKITAFGLDSIKSGDFMKAFL
jgi:predicted AAA+ superfamily ATPase